MTSMTDTHPPQGTPGPHGSPGPAGPASPETERHPQAPEEFDRDLDLRAIIWTGVGVAGMTIVSAILMMLMMRIFGRVDAKSGATLPVPAKAVAEAPPEPRLQPSSRADMEAMRAAEELDLQHASWVDPRQGTVRLPIDLAIDVIAAQGLPRTPATGASNSIDRGPTNQVSPGTVLPAPGQGVGQLGPSAAAPISLSGATPTATDVPGQTRPPLLATPAPIVAAPAAPPPAAPPAQPSTKPPPARPPGPGEVP
jgi:hypothetical protein